MKTLLLLLPAALFGGSAALQTPDDPVREAVATDGFEELNTAYETALATWKDQLGEADGLKARKALREAHPAKAFWPRFDALAKTGNGQALLWMASNVRDKGVKSRERADVMRPLYDQLAKEHSNADWFETVFDQLDKDKRKLGDEYALSFFALVVEKSKVAENKAGALFHASQLLIDSEDEKAIERANAMRFRIETDFNETTWGEKLRILKARAFSEVGGIAPNFKGTTIDGFEFELEDYRGKVVVLDFYGFW